MAKLLNEAYALIQDAPLGNGQAIPFSAGIPRASDENRGQTQASTGPGPSNSSGSEYVQPDPPDGAAEHYRMIEKAREAGAHDDAARPFDSIGFAVRFVFGALFGGLVSFRIMIALWRHPTAVPVAVAVTILLCAFASGFGGDAFWRAIRPGSLWWWRRWR